MQKSLMQKEIIKIMDLPATKTLPTNNAVHGRNLPSCNDIECHSLMFRSATNIEGEQYGFQLDFIVERISLDLL
jgi:hypothetical protein